MAEKKKEPIFWWLKLDAAFFESRPFRIFKTKPNPDTLGMIYLQMLTRYVTYENFIFPIDQDSSSVEEIAIDLERKEEDVQTVLDALEKCNCIKSVENGIQFAVLFEKTGSKTATAIRMQRSRDNRKNLVTDDRNNVTKCRNIVTDFPTEKELEKELEKDHHNDDSVCDDLLKFFNQQSGKRLRGKNQLSAIKKQLATNTPEEIKLVFEWCAEEWNKDNSPHKDYFKPVGICTSEFKDQWLPEAQKWKKEKEERERRNENAFI